MDRRHVLSSELFLLDAVNELRKRLGEKYQKPQIQAEARIDTLALLGLESLHHEVTKHSPFADPEDRAMSSDFAIKYRTLIMRAQQENWEPVKEYLLAEAADEAQESVLDQTPDYHMTNSRLLFKLGNSI